MTEAKRWVERSKNEPTAILELLDGELGELQFFALPAGSSSQH